MKQEQRSGRLVARLLAVTFAVFVLLGIGLAWGGVPAQEPGEPGSASVAREPTRATPRDTVKGFLEAGRAENYARATLYLDFGALPEPPDPATSQEYARNLKVVLDRTLWIDLELVSDEPAGETDDTLEPELERIGSIPARYGEVPVLLRRSESPNGEQTWLFAPYTVAAVPELFAEHGYGWLEEVLPRTLFEIRVLEIELWQWIGLLIAVLLASLLGFLGAALIVRALRLVVRPAEATWDVTLLGIVAGPLRFGLGVLAFYAASFLLALTVPAREFVALACKALSVVAVTWLLLRIVDVFGSILHERLRAKDANAADTLIPMGRRITKGFVLALAVVSLIHNLGFNVAGILTGLGVGGLAVALAAQKTIENLFGGISVIADKPVEVGEFCRVGEHVGIVEEIGMRSTRIRTLDRTLLTIPNAEFSTARIENFARRDKMRLFATLQVGYDTSPEQMRYLLVELRRMLYAHPRTLSEPCRVRFSNLGAYSLDIEIFVFVDTRDWNEFLGIREDVYLRIMDIVKASGTYFAYPSQTLYLGRDEGRNPDRTAEAEEIVAGWREARALHLPEFPPEAVAAVDDTLDFPPVGSSAAG